MAGWVGGLVDGWMDVDWWMDGRSDDSLISRLGCLLDVLYVPCIYRMPGGVTVGDWGLCCCVPVQCVTSIVRAQLLPIVC